MDAKVLLFDIEATALDAQYGRMLCFGWEWLGSDKPHTKTIAQFDAFKRNPVDDGPLVKFAAQILSQADLWVTWYGQRYDVPFIQTRLLAARQPPLPPVAHDDAWQVARNRMKFKSNRLASVSEFLRDTLGETEQSLKTPLSPGTWARAGAGHRPSIAYVAEHCKVDVVVLRQVYLRLRAFNTQPTNINLAAGKAVNPLCCPRCGSLTLTHRGWTLAKTARRPRYKCLNCGGWCSGKPQRLAETR